MKSQFKCRFTRSRLVMGLTLASLVGACGKTNEAAKSEPAKVVLAKDEAPRIVKLHTVSGAATASEAVLAGELRPRAEIRESFRVPGKMTARLVEAGQTVRKGQPLARLDAGDYGLAVAGLTQQVDAAKTDRDLAKLELDRLRALREKGFISVSQVDRQQAALDAAESRLKGAQSQLAQSRNQQNYTMLAADTAGVVTGVEAEPGQVMAAGQTVVRIAQTGKADAVVAVPEAQLGAFKNAKAYRVVTAAMPDAPYDATLREVAPTADAASRTYAVKLAVDMPPEAMQWGMSLVAQPLRSPTQAGTATGVAVPQSALFTRDGKPRVWVVKQEGDTLRVTAREVTSGVLQGEMVSVPSGLKLGERVVSAGANLLLEGQRVIAWSAR